MIDPSTHTDAYWVGRMSACIGESAVRTQDRYVREDLRACLAEFIASPVPTEALRVKLRPYLNGGKR